MKGVIVSKTKIAGRHLIADLVNLDEALCLDAPGWLKAFINASQELGLEIVASNSHIFKPPKQPGLTAFLLLDSSHFSVHSYSDVGIAAVDLFSCRDKDLSQTFMGICKELGITKDNVLHERQIRRFEDGE
ncbi:MAG: hypothetical protein C4542_07530 [Dehalococcoidia bacterium]|nr:MAG: hypothetical protein C4542_07530 [Dehalococcoidia bacterium]